MFHRIRQTLAKASLYQKAETAFWNDKYISKQMLEAHLNPEFEGASRNLKFVEKSVVWIERMVPPAKYPLLLDLGCGPGIYAEKFTEIGYQVLGIDFSKRSINYARESARKKKLNVHYVYQDYLEMDLKKTFDFSTMIYCDYGALSTTDRRTVMEKAYQHLKPSGKFLLDVFSMAKYNDFKEKQTWEICPDGGFWHEREYVAFTGCYKFTDNVTLEQTSIFSEAETATYYVWNTYFTKENLIEEANAAGFTVCEVFGDVAGSSYRGDSLTIAILLEK